MKKITKSIMALVLAVGLMIGWGVPAQATPDFSGYFDPESKGGLVTSLGNSLYEMVDGELVEVTELEMDKIYFIQATLKNVVAKKLTYYNPGADIYDGRLHGIQFQIELPTSISSDIPGTISLAATAFRCNYDDLWNESSATLEVTAKGNSVLALEYAPGYCDETTQRWIGSCGYYLQGEERHTILSSVFDADTFIAAGATRNIMIAVHACDATALAKKIENTKTDRFQANFLLNWEKNDAISAIPIVGDLVMLRKNAKCIDESLIAEIVIPDRYDEQDGDYWHIQTKCRAYAEDGAIVFWAGLYNYSTRYELSGDAAQSLFDEQTAYLLLQEVEAWYYDNAGEKQMLTILSTGAMPDLVDKSGKLISVENNGIEADIDCSGLFGKSAGHKIYVRYDYSRVNLEDVRP